MHLHKKYDVIEDNRENNITLRFNGWEVTGPIEHFSYSRGVVRLNGIDYDVRAVTEIVPS